jgi:hypothetical protein
VRIEPIARLGLVGGGTLGFALGLTAQYLSTNNFAF